ncbi:MAG: AAA family ATPase [Chloroflexi bacterium]|nr:AAA family ATPase [Chloroflexota bacterium]
MTRLELNLIGVPEVVLDGQPVVFARRGSIALLAYLALSQRAYPRDTLAALLARDGSEDQARKYLSNVLVDLRQHLGGYVRATRQTVAFDRTLPSRVDVDEFRAQLQIALGQESTSGLEKAVRLYRGEFLSGLTLADAPDFDAWLFAQREELRGQYMQALRAEVDASLRRGAWSSGITPARRLIAEEPWLEDVHRQLMLMLAHSGQRQAAIAQYHTCRRVLREELGVEPMPETTALFKRMRAAISPPPHNLPTPSSLMVGRHEQMRLLFGLLTDPDCQLITLTGMGGSGKTRLSLEVARAFASPTTAPPEQPFADGIVFVALAESPTCGTDNAGHTVLATCATALDVPSDGSLAELRERLTLYLKDRAVLLVLDNFEHLRSGAGEVYQLLGQAPHLKVLATCRAPLHLEGERVLHVDGLGLPTGPADVECAEASALFLLEARRVQVGFSLPDSQRPYLVKMCRQLGGFPLALILAARWAPVLPCSEMVRELADGLDVLSTPEADLPERHRSVPAILDSALAQLSTEERALAEALADEPREANRLPNAARRPSEMLPGLRRLSEQALVTIDGTCGTARLHPLLSRYVRGGTRGRRGPTRLRSGSPE